MTKLDRRNKYCFGLGTIGRDMFYSLESMYLLYFLTEIRQLDDAMLALVGGILTVLRIVDAFNDPITGVIIDNTRTRWGKFKPWIVFGTITSGILAMMLFSDPGLDESKFVVFIGVTTFALSTCGTWMGGVFGARFKNKAEFAGGAILVLMGGKILLEHLGILG